MRPTSAAKRCDPREEFGTQQVRTLAVTPKADSYRPDIEAIKSAMLVEESESSVISVVVIAAMRTWRANPFMECVSGQCTSPVMA